MTGLWNNVRKDLRRHRREPLTFLVWLGIPLLIGTLFTLLFGGKEGVQPSAHLLIVDEDQTFVSGLLLRGLDAENTRGFIDGEQVDADEGARRMAAGKADAMLTLPKGFGDAILNETPLALPLVTNPAERILPRIVEEMLQVLVDGHFYLHRLLGDELRWLANQESAPSDADIAAFSGRIRDRITRLQTYVNPLLITVEDEPEPDGAAQPEQQPMALMFLPGLLFMALLFMSQGLSREFWEEQEQYTLHRALMTPGGAWPFVLGKLVTAWILMLVVTAISLALAVGVYHISAAVLLPGLVWASLAGAGLMAAFTLLALALPNARAANLLGVALVFPLMMLGGSFFPFVVMPAWMAQLGRLTPNGWALQRLEAILDGTLAPPALLGGAAAMLVFTALVSAVNVTRLSRRLGRG